MSSSVPSIFAYLDYRAYLRDYHAFRKRGVPSFSLRLLSRKIGFSSPSFLKLVMDGRKNLSQASVRRIAEALMFSARQTEYFAVLVRLSQARTLEEKGRLLDRLDAFRTRNAPRALEPSQYDYLKRWYHMAIRELALMPGFRETPEWIASQLLFPVQPRGASASLGLLLELGLLHRTLDGAMSRRTPTLATGVITEDALAAVAQRHHTTMIEFAKQAVLRFARAERNVTNTTLGLSAKGYQEVLRRVEQARMEILEIAASDSAADRVYQLNINLFPLSRKRGDHE